MRLLLIILFSLIGLSAYSQTYSRDGLGIKWIQLEGCRKVSNGQPADSCFVMTNGINGKLSRCLHISELRALITGGIGPTDSTYLVDNLDGSYSLFNENGTEYPFGYKFEEVGDTIFLTDLDGHRADTLVMSLLDNQTLSWDPGTGDLGIANGNTVNLDGRYLLSEVDGDPTNELQFVDTFSVSNDTLYISLDRDSVASSYVVIPAGADGNGIYGGSGYVPDTTYANIPLNQDFAIGWFPDFPNSITDMDRGLWFSGNEFYLYANDSILGGLARIYTSDLDVITVATLDSAESYVHVDPNRAIMFSEDGINATNITTNPDSLDMYSRLWTPEFDSARLRLETTYGNAGDVLTSDGLNMRWAAPSGGGNGIYGGSGTVPDLTYAQIGTEAPHSNIAQDSVFAIGYHPSFPNVSLTNSRGIYFGSTASGFYLLGADTTNFQYSYTGYGSAISHAVGNTSDPNLITYDVIDAGVITRETYNATDTSFFDMRPDSIDIETDVVNLQADDALRLMINGTYGTNGYVLTSDGTNAEWAAASSGSTPSIITPSQITSDQDNYDPTGFGTATIVRISGDASIRAITSMAAQDDGEEKKIINVGSYPVYFPAQHPDGTAANRINYDRDIILMPSRSITFVYDTVSDRWNVLNFDFPNTGKITSFNQVAGSSTSADFGVIAFTLAGSGTGAANLAASNTIPFVRYALSSGTTATGSVIVYFTKSSLRNGVYGDMHYGAESLIQIEDLSDATDSFTAFLILDSLASTGNITGNGLCGIKYSHGLYGGNWTGFTTNAAGTVNNVDLGLAVAADTPYSLRVEIDKECTEARFYVNGVMRGRSTTNMPPTNTTFGVKTGILKGVGGTSRTVHVGALGYNTVIP